MRNHRTPAEIERDIRETQAEMDSTVDALRRKLSPGELFGQTVDYFRESGSSAGHTLMEQVRERPLPLAFLATGLAWLMMSEGGGRRRAEISGRERFGRMAYRELDESDFKTITQYGDCFRALADVRPSIDESGEEFANRLYPAMAQALGLRQEPAERPERFRQRVERAFDDLSGRAEEAQHKLAHRAQRQWQRTREGARAAMETATHGVQRTGEQVRHAGEAAAYQVRHAGDVAADRARRAGEQAADTYQRYPLAMGALVLAAGALIGTMLPSTRREREVLGETGEELRETAGAYAREAARAAGDVADRMAGAARERAEREGLMPERAAESTEDVAERLRRTGEEAVEAGREEAERRLHGTPSGRTGTSSP